MINHKLQLFYLCCQLSGHQIYKSGLHKFRCNFRPKTQATSKQCLIMLSSPYRQNLQQRSAILFLNHLERIHMMSLKNNWLNKWLPLNRDTYNSCSVQKNYIISLLNFFVVYKSWLVIHPALMESSFKNYSATPPKQCMNGPSFHNGWHTHWRANTIGRKDYWSFSSRGSRHVCPAACIRKSLCRNCQCKAADSELAVPPPPKLFTALLYNKPSSFSTFQYCLLLSSAIWRCSMEM